MLNDSAKVVQRQYRLIHDIYLFLSAVDRNLLQRFGLTPTQFSVMLLLDREIGLPLVTLSERVFVARSTITRVVDHLEAAGLAQRATHSNDRRSQRVILTQAGQELRDRVRQAQIQILEEQLKGLSGDEHWQLVVLLQKMRDGLEPAFR